jgi:phosphatidylglycerophosphate synthase
MFSFPRSRNIYKQVPNLISLSRVIFGAFLINSLLHKDLRLFWLSLFLTFVSDALDGFLARRLNAVSDIGKILDHVIDKGLILSASFILSLLYGLPRWVFFLLLIREILTIVVALYFRVKRGSFPSSNPIGKLFGLFSTLVLITFFYDLEVKFIILYIAIIFMFISSLANLISLRA